MHQSIYFLSFLAVIQLSYACYITNCPIGGKRNLAAENNLHNHQCPRCGFNGQCFGPSICCNALGCRIGHPSDIRQCSTENRSLSPCSIQSAACSAIPNGRCAASGICCGTDSCHVDDACSISSKQETADRSSDESHVMSS